MDDSYILDLIGTPAYPLRASSLATLMTCQKKWLIDRADEVAKIMEEKKAADTGSAVHMAARHWHNTGSWEEAVRAMEDNLPQYPAADLADARLSFRPYCDDARNHVFGDKIKCETHVTIQTKAGVVVSGHVDQLRQNFDGRWYVYDVKTGKENGWDYLHKHAYQMAAYVLASRATLGLDILAGGLICTYGYRSRRGGESRSVFQEYADLSLAKCELLLAQAVWEFERLRSARKAETRHGTHCTFCRLNFFKCLGGE